MNLVNSYPRSTMFPESPSQIEDLSSAERERLSFGYLYLGGMFADLSPISLAFQRQPVNRDLILPGLCFADLWDIPPTIQPRLNC